MESSRKEGTILPNVKLKHSSVKKKKVNLFLFGGFSSEIKTRTKSVEKGKKKYQLLNKRKKERKEKLNLSKGPCSG